MLKIAATFCAVLIAVSAFSTSAEARHGFGGGVRMGDLVAPAWVVSLARVLVPLIFAALAWALLVPGE
jgi:hypothetical protein